MHSPRWLGGSHVPPYEDAGSLGPSSLSESSTYAFPRKLEIFMPFPTPLSGDASS
jgi:hypothetical protein